MAGRLFPHGIGLYEQVNGAAAAAGAPALIKFLGLALDDSQGLSVLFALVQTR